MFGTEAVRTQWINYIWDLKLEDILRITYLQNLNEIVSQNFKSPFTSVKLSNAYYIVVYIHGVSEVGGIGIIICECFQYTQYVCIGTIYIFWYLFLIFFSYYYLSLSHRQ